MRKKQLTLPLTPGRRRHTWRWYASTVFCWLSLLGWLALALGVWRNGLCWLGSCFLLSWLLSRR